jgi:hypothetical protein
MALPDFAIGGRYRLGFDLAAAKVRLCAGFWTPATTRL